ncbi:MAG: phytoene/squalene synthase family protein [Myxococcota bacterium]
MVQEVGVRPSSRPGPPTPPGALVREASHRVLAHHARSFSLAALFLPRHCRDDAAVLYAFCRAVDDAVDESEDAQQAAAALKTYREGLEGRRAEGPVRSPCEPSAGESSAGESSAGEPETFGRARALAPSPPPRSTGGPPAALVCAAVREMTQRRGMPTRAAHQLIDGMEGDLDVVRIADDRGLLRYCYRAAGTVGWLMCGVLGVNARGAVPHAVDLGIAMQITNICRDVAEDAARGRVYLPEARLRAAGTSGAALLAGRADRGAVAKVTRDLLALADRYYDSAAAGMAFIPARPRLAIYVAAKVYRAIGVRLLHHQAADPTRGRVVVPRLAKAGWVAVALAAWAWSLRRGLGAAAPLKHQRGLHDHLHDLVPVPA